MRSHDMAASRRSRGSHRLPPWAPVFSMLTASLLRRVVKGFGDLVLECSLSMRIPEMATHVKEQAGVCAAQTRCENRMESRVRNGDCTSHESSDPQSKTREVEKKRERGMAIPAAACTARRIDDRGDPRVGVALD